MEVLRILDEKKLEELVSNMDDRIRMHDYSKEQLLLLIEDYVTINFQGMKYQTKRITSAIRKELMESFFGLSDIHFSERIGLDRIDHK